MNKSDPGKYKLFFDELAERILVCDGAMGTELQARGVSGCPDAANIDKEAREKVIGVHLDYLEAGSDIIQTNTFGANPVKLSSCGLEAEADDINREAVLNARKAIDRFHSASSSERRCFIAGDVGPTGKLMEPSGDLEYSKAVDVFSRQISVLAESGADLILIETIMDLNEALAAVEAARSISESIPIACTMSFGENGVTLMGNKAGESAGILLDAGCDIVGANCSVGSDSMLEIVKKIRSAWPGARLIFQPNAGLPVIRDGRTAYNETPDIMADNISHYLAYGPSIVGACCGSTPDHIRKIASMV
jgi:5-methyltetrahydrofolate--homocysteine methyltransferase